MSEKKNVAPATENEKVMTKYDLKMQRRKEEAAKAKRDEVKGTIIGIALVVALAAFVASFPIRSWLSVNGSYIKVGGQKVTQAEFSFQYNVAKTTYLQQMGSYLSMMGITDTNTIDYQMYSDTLTFGDYFEQMAAENIASNRGIMAKAKEAGFTYDVSEDVAEMKANMEEEAKAQGVTLEAFLQENYGPLATWKRLEPFFEENMYVSAYYAQVAKELEPTAEELDAAYEAGKNDYDCVDYHLTTIKAELPTTAPDGTVEKDEEGNEIPYEPTEEEVAAAMKEAKKEADKAVKTVTKDGVENLGKKYSSINTKIRDFLFEEERKVGDTTIVEDTNANRYLVVSFDGRYKDEAPTYDYRLIFSSTTDAQTILDEWKAGEATEESFQELVEKYDEMGSAAFGGIYSGMTADIFGEEVQAWIEGDRTAGDTTAITKEGENPLHYVVYYVGENEVQWKLDAESNLLSERLAAFMEEAMADIKIEDPKGNLAYLKIAEASATE